MLLSCAPCAKVLLAEGDLYATRSLGGAWKRGQIKHSWILQFALFASHVGAAGSERLRCET